MKRIAWCTPFSAASSISEFSHTLIESYNSDPELKARAQIDVLVNENGRRYRSTSKCLSIRQVLSSQDSIGLFAEHYDDVFYNLGNNKENHQDIFDLAAKAPGIAILHDYVYQHYLAARIFTDSNAPKVYAYLMGRHYGASGLASVHASQILRPRESRIGLWDTDLTSRYPLIEAIVANPRYKGIVVHSDMVRRAVAETFSGPILQLRLPGDEKESPSAETIARWREDTGKRSRVTVAVIGHIQRGKQIHRLLDAIFSAPGIADLLQTVIIAGKPADSEYVEHLRKMILDHPLGALVRLELNVSHERLQEIKEAADFFVNVRHPNTEGGSGSLIEQLACNKAVIVLNSGIFAEVKGGVIKIENLHDHAEMQRAIHKLASSAEYRVQLGDEARQYAMSFLSRDYMREALDFSASLKKENRLATQLDFNEILLYDSETRGPEPLFQWGDAAFAEFAKIIFQPYFSQEFLDYLARSAQQDKINAYKRYSFARVLLSFFDHAAKGEECKYWLLPAHLNFADCYVLACLKEQHYHTFAGLLSGVGVLQIKQWSIVAQRFSTATIVERFALLLALWKDQNAPVSQAEFGDFCDIIKATVSAKFIEVVRLVATLPEEDFSRLMLGEWRNFIDTRQYRSSYLDLHEGIHGDHETLVKHYEAHGKNEGRVARVSLQRLLSATKK